MEKRTGAIDGHAIRFVFAAIGKPIFHLVLILLFACLITAAFIFKLSLQSIRLTRSLSIKATEQLTSFTKKHSSLIFTKVSDLSHFLPHYLSKILVSPKVEKPIRLIFVILLCLTSIIILTIGIAQTINALPDPERLITRNQIVSTKIYDRNGKLLFKVFNNENRSLVDMSDIPPHLIQATVAIEDKDFYTHKGFSVRGIARAAYNTLIKKQVEGGSTITQQLVKNTLLTKEKTIKRKLQELLLALLVEAKFTKDEILLMYFNEVGYGGAAYGVEEAAQTYFAKSVKHLTLAETALVAGLPAAPTYYSPFGPHPERAKFRQHEVLRRMVEDGYITLNEAEAAKATKLALTPKKIDIKAPHFVMYVQEILVEKFGEPLVKQGGLEVTTSLDLEIQELAQKAVTEEVARLAPLNITNGAALVTNPKTGEILAMVGSQNYFDFDRDGQVNVTLRPRQPGSAIKPINYAVALENGMTAATILSDTPITYSVPGQPPYTPKNYDGTFHGNVTLRAALANSYNVPAVKVLSTNGVERMIEKGEAMGITTWKDRARYGLSLTLGGGEVKMIDLATAYGLLANGGYRIDPAPILKVTNYKGELLYRYQCPPTGHAMEDETCQRREVVKPEVAFILTDILSDNQARTPAFGRYSLLTIPGHQVAVKTGTTQNLRDNWTLGFTTNILVTTWVGNNDNTSMSYVASGVTGASPIWNAIMSTLLAETQDEKFEPPPSLIQVAVCSQTGTLPCAGCPGRPEYFMRGTEPQRACLPTVADNPEEPPKNPTPSQDIEPTPQDIQPAPEEDPPERNWKKRKRGIEDRERVSSPESRLSAKRPL